MNINRLRAVFLFAVLFLNSSQAHAYHSNAMCDMDPVTTIQGPVTKLEWTNPPTYFDLDVKDDKGMIEKWTVESACPAALTRSGWNRTAIKEGDMIAVSGHRSKDGRKFMLFEKAMLHDGREVSLNEVSSFSGDRK